MAVNLTDGGVVRVHAPTFVSYCTHVHITTQYRLRHVPTRNVLTLKTVDDNTKTEFGPLTVSKENNSKASLGAAQTVHFIPRPGL